MPQICIFISHDIRGELNIILLMIEKHLLPLESASDLILVHRVRPGAGSPGVKRWESGFQDRNVVCRSAAGGKQRLRSDADQGDRHVFTLPRIAMITRLDSLQSIFDAVL